MDDGQEQDQYEERLKEVFHSFDASGSGSLSPEELSDLCQSLQLGEATPALLHGLLLDQDHLTARVDFDQFKHALILVLSSTVETPQADEETLPKPDSPEIQPKFVKGSKRYGRRSTPGFLESAPDFSEDDDAQPAEEGGDVDADEEEEEDSGDSAVPRKRERWNAHETSPEEYEAEGQLHLWNPDEPGTPRGSMGPLPERLEERLREACEELALPRDGCASQAELLGLCEHLGLEIPADVLQSVTGDDVVDIREFVFRVLNPCKPPTPSASTPYRQLKRHHSSQPFDEAGRRIATPSAMTSTIGTRLFSTLDDGTGYTPVESVLDAWVEEGIENSLEILQALDFNLDGKVNLGELTMALENELLVTKNGIHQAALASFKAEIRHLMEQVDRELREKEKIRSDLEKAEKLKSQLATEVDEHHSAIEHMNNLNLRKLELEHKEKVAALRAELTEEMDQMQQQAGLQREGLEAEMEKIRDDETFLRDHLSISIKENRRLEMELLDSTERLIEAQSQVTKLQTNMDNVLKEKFGELDPGCADFFLQEERLKQLRSEYEEQCRELQDRIDELQSELQDFHSLGRTSQSCKPLSEELESKSPGNESDPGIGSEEVQPFSMSLEAEMMLEQLKERHLREVEDLQAQLESKVSEFEQKAEEQRTAHEEQKAAISLRYLEDVKALEEEMATAQTRSQALQNQLEQAELERASLGERQAGERTDLEARQEEEVGALRQQLSEAHAHTADLEERLRSLESLEAQQAAAKLILDTELEELKTHHALELNKLEMEQEELMEYRLEEERLKRHEERAALVKRLLEEWEKEKEELKQTHEEELKARLEEAGLRFEAEREELELRLTERWEKERAQLEEQSNESLQAVLEEGMLRLLKEQEEKESTLREQWELERALLRDSHEELLLTRLAEERLRLQEQHEERERKLREEWEREKLQLEEDYEGMLRDRLNEEREELEASKEEAEKRLGQLLEEEKTRLEESHREAIQELTAKHSEEREELSGALDQLREDIAEERCEATRLAEENLVLRSKIAKLKEEDIREELLQKLERLRKEKVAAQKMAENLKMQISGLLLRSQQLEDENGLLSEKNAQNAAGVEELSHQLAELLRENKKETTPAEERTQMAACVSDLEAELITALEGTAQLEDKNQQLTEQLSGLREKVAAVDHLECQLSHLLQERKTEDKEAQLLYNQLSKAQDQLQTHDASLQTVNFQNARLKSDLRVTQQEKDALKQEVVSLHKQMKNAVDKNHTLEVALHTSGFQSPHKKLYREELARLVEQEQQLLRQENERLLMEVRSTKGDLVLSREKVKQLETTILSLKQQRQLGQSCLAKTLEQENTSLKQELEELKLLTKGWEDGDGRGAMETLKQENEALKSQMARMHSQLLESFQSQLAGLLPPSPHRIPRGQHRGDDPDNMQDERDRKMKIMVERMTEIELSLRNVKLLLREKVSQLKEQLYKNGKADVLIKDLYVENAQLLKALEVTEQRQKVAEKKNYLLEEKISSLNKIVRDLKPSPLPPSPYRYTRS